MRISFVGILSTAYNRLKEVRFRWTSRKQKFDDIFHKRGFGGEVSVSGPGSSLMQTSIIRKEFPDLVKEIDVHVLLDAPCGDFHWLKEVNLDIDKYIGADIVPDLIKMNQERYENSKRDFLILDIVKNPVPKVDLILCRDCFVHLSNKDISRALRNFGKSNSTYLLTTTFTGVLKNRDIVTGRWRPINLQKHPFNFPKPIKLINEHCTEQDGKYADKCLGLWKLDELTM